MVAFVELIIYTAALVEPRTEIFVRVLFLGVFVDPAFHYGNRHNWNICAPVDSLDLFKLAQRLGSFNVDAVVFVPLFELASWHHVDWIASLPLLRLDQVVVDEVGVDVFLFAFPTL